MCIILLIFKFFFHKVEVEFNKRLPVRKVKGYKQSGNCMFVHHFLSSNHKKIFFSGENR